MGGVFRPRPKFLSVLSSLRARCVSVRTEIPGEIFQCECEAFIGQTRNSWRYLPIWMCEGFSVRTQFPGDISQVKCDVLFSQNQSPWRLFPGRMRGFFRPEPKFLAIFSNSNARCCLVRTEILGGVSQFKCEAFFG